MDIAIVGGGAAGFFGAIAAAQANPAARVILLEAGQEPLAKVRISGGGRCNVTHACFEPAALIQNYPRGSKALRGPFSRFHPQHTVQWFRQRGVNLKTEADGRMFPTTDRSETIIDCLTTAAIESGVQIRTRTPITEITKTDQRFCLRSKTGQLFGCDRLLVATGSNPKGYAIAQTLGHTIVSPVPSLFTFQVADSALRDLAGVSQPHTRATLNLPNQKPLIQTGPILITHWGLSGPAVLKLSAWGARALQQASYRTNVEINWLPDQNPETLLSYFLQYKTEHPRRSLHSQCPVTLPKRLWQYCLDRAQLHLDKRWAEASKKELRRLANELTKQSHSITGKGVFKDEFVTCGGVLLKEVNFKTMQSRCCSGLYFAGEILDIDGITGGFNFQNAWTTGWIAGQSMGQQVT